MSIRVPTVSSRSRVAIEAWAERFHGTHYPELLEEPGQLPVLHMIDVVLPRDYNIISGVDHLPSGIEGITEPPNFLTLDVAVYEGIVRGDGRCLFTGAHETYHALVHLRELQRRFESGGGGVGLHRRTDLPAYQDPEWQADAAAAALLMPARATWQLIEKYGYSPEPLREKFGVGFKAASLRVTHAAEGKLWRPV